MSHAELCLTLRMYIRKKQNKSGSISVQIISKSGGRYSVIKSLGSSRDAVRIGELVNQGEMEIRERLGQQSIFVFEKDIGIAFFLDTLENSQIRTIGPELVFGKVYDYIGYHKIEGDLFRHLVIARLSYPLSKLKTVDYLYRYQGITIEIDSIYRYLDKLNKEYKKVVEQISYAHTLRVLEGQISIVFYDMTTLYFEASDEDDLRKTGFSKDGKHSNPQIYLGLLVGLGGYAIGYDIFEGNIYEGHTLIPVLEKMSQKFNLTKPIVVADSGLLNKDNVRDLESKGYQYILGARLKNENKATQEQLLSTSLKNEEMVIIEKERSKLIVQYADKRAKKDEHNRKRGLERLEKQVKGGKLNKNNINNRGYNKYLTMVGEVQITIDYDKFEQDKQWDGLKGYLTNCQLTPKEITEHYRNLWHIEKAFRISKTDLRIRPIYHRLRRRIEAHICISFAAYTIYKELERVLKIEKFELSVEKAAEITHNMYQLEFVLPESRQKKTIVLKMDEVQTRLVNIVQKHF